MRKLHLALLILLLSALPPLVFGQQQYQYPFQNPHLPLEQRIHNLLSLLTLQEKIDLLGKTLNIPRLGIHGSGAVDTIPGSNGQFEGLHGLAVGGPNRWGRRSPGAGDDTSTIPTTQFPQPSGLGETWDPVLVQSIADQEAHEARYIFQSFDRGGLILRAPNADLARDPRWGRFEESYGEDPYLTGTLSVAFVRGLQGDDPRTLLTVSLVKHFLANSNEDTRTSSSSNFDDRLLHEYYAVPFRMTIEQGGADAIMTAYNAVNGIPMATSPLLKSLVMKQWGLNGMIDTDRGALDFMWQRHRYYPNGVESVAGAIHAGVNQFLNAYQDDLHTALQRNLVTEAEINQNLEGVLRILFRLGIMDPPALVPYTKIGKADGVPVPWDQDSAHELALRATRESIVLLRNVSHLLPLDRSSVQSIVVLGPLADVVDLDGYSGTPPLAVTPLQGIRSKVGSAVQVRYTPDDAQAVGLAKTSDVAIVFVGNRPFCRHKRGEPPCVTPSDGQEGIDRKSLSLDADQEKLVEEVTAANPRTIVVLVSSFPFAIDWAKQHVPSILQIAHNSEEEGAGIADVLFGDYNPSGHLDVTWPASLDQLPPLLDYDIRHGRTYMYFHGAPLFPFGYGLSYTTFSFSGLKTSASRLSSGKALNVSVHVANTGSRAGDTVVQMYVKHLDSKVPRPQLELVGFQRVSLPARQSKTVTLSLPASSLRYWDTGRKRWELEDDQVSILVGNSSADLPLTRTIRVR